MVIPVFLKEENLGFWGHCIVHIFIINNQSGRIVNSYSRQQVDESGSLFFDGSVVDFAPYKLNENTRAFGIRLKNYRLSSGAPFQEEYIYLFIRKGNKLVPVLDNFNIYHYDGLWSQQCRGIYTEEKKLIILSQIKTNGYCDLIIKNTINDIRTSEKGEDCVSDTTTEYKKQVLKFQNGIYK